MCNVYGQVRFCSGHTSLTRTRFHFLTGLRANYSRLGDERSFLIRFEIGVEIPQVVVLGMQYIIRCQQSHQDTMVLIVIFEGTVASYHGQSCYRLEEFG